MYETVSVDEAISKGHKMITYPVIIIVVLTCICFYLTNNEYAIPIGFGIALVYWNVFITKWRLWAFDNVRNVHELQRRAVYAKLIWAEGTIFIFPFLRKSIQEKWNLILDKFKQKDIFDDDVSIPEETIIYYSKIKNLFPIAIMLAGAGGGFCLVFYKDQYLLGGGCFLVCGYFVYDSFKKETNTQPQIIINEKGIKTASSEFAKWEDISGEMVIEEHYRRSTSYYLIYTYNEGREKLEITNYNISQKELENLLRIYRGRSIGKKNNY